MTAGAGANPLVSVIVPARNAQAFIATAVASACAQSYRNLEVLVVDDGSRDRTRAIVRALAECDRRVRLLTQRHRGVAAARNRAIVESRGQYIAPLDADDIWFAQKIERQVRALEKAKPDVGLAYAWSVDVDERDRMTGGYYAHDAPSCLAAALIFRNVVGCGSVPLIRRGCLEQTGLYQPGYAARGAQGCEDLDLYRRIAERYEFVLVPEFLVAYRQSPGRMSSNTFAMARSFDLALRDCRRRRPDVPPRVFRWSLARQCFMLHYRARGLRHYGSAAALLLAAIGSDPRLLLEPRFYRVLRAGRARRSSTHPGSLSPAAPVALADIEAARARRPTALFDLFEALESQRLRFTERYVSRPARAAPVASRLAEPAAIVPAIDDSGP